MKWCLFINKSFSSGHALFCHDCNYTLYIISVILIYYTFFPPDTLYVKDISSEVNQRREGEKGEGKKFNQIFVSF